MGSRKRGDSPYLPYISWKHARTSWLLINNQAYPLEMAPEPIFRSVITPSLPLLEDQEQVASCLKETRTDLLARWWLLCGLADIGKKVRLYSSREEALLAVRAR